MVKQTDSRVHRIAVVSWEGWRPFDKGFSVVGFERVGVMGCACLLIGVFYKPLTPLIPVKHISFIFKFSHSPLLFLFFMYSLFLYM